MVGSGIKAKVLGGFLSSKGLLTGNVVDFLLMEMWKIYKKYFYHIYKSPAMSKFSFISGLSVISP